MIRFDSTIPIKFKGVEKKPETMVNKDSAQKETKQINELPNVTMPIKVNTPVGYTKIGVNKLDNGIEIHNYKLANGLKVSIVPMETNSTTIKTFVNTGAINEDDSQRGISHFLEHMAFNGTIGSDNYKKLQTGDVFRLVSNIGGYTNASTNFALTDYIIQAPLFYDTDLEEIISIQGAMINNLELPESMIEKERGPVISEINMYYDIPNMLAYNLAVKNLYNIETSSKDVIAGSVNNIKNLTRDDVINYYRANYHPSNMYTTLAGDVNPDEAIKIIAKHFHSTVTNPPQQKINKFTPINTSIRRDIKSNKASENSGYIAFNGPDRTNLKDNIALNIVQEILFGSTNTRLDKQFDNTSISMFMNLETISTNPKDGQLLYFSYYANEEEYEKALEALYTELENFKDISDKDLELVKKKLAREYDEMTKKPGPMLHLLNTFHFGAGQENLVNYKETLYSITNEDIKNCVKKYLDLNKASIAIVHPQKNENSTVNFTGRKKREILKPQNINTYHFANNYEVASYNTKGDYQHFTLKLQTEKIPEQKAGTAKLMNIMLNDGVANFSKNELDSILANKLIDNSIYSSTNGINIFFSCDKQDAKTALEIVNMQIFEPNFTEESLCKAKEKIKNILKSSDTTAVDLIYDKVFAQNINACSNEALLKSIENITLEDIKQLHQAILSNGIGAVAFTTSQNDNEYTESILKTINELPKVKKQTYNSGREFLPIKNEKVLTHENNNAQAEIAIGYPYKNNKNMQDNVLFAVTEGLLSKLAFNDLREKQHLAYSVGAFNIKCEEKNNVLVCNILTTTNDEDTGETSYDNVQKSINGFKKIIDDIKNGNFREEDLNAIILEEKANMLEYSDSDTSKINIINDNLTSPYGVLYPNQRYTELDKITKSDIVKAANYMFKEEPTYGITANKNTIDYNKKYFEELIK